MMLQNRSLCFALIAIVLSENTGHCERPLAFNRDIRPILSDRCFACHGPDTATAEAGLRLDSRDVAVDSGAIVPGSPEDSEMIARITAEDEDLVMPPVEVHKPLDKQQVATLRRWIKEGAPYEPHWAYTPLHRPAPPEAEDPRWNRNPLDRFVAARLQEESLTPSPVADPVTLIRRVTFDLTGMPPTPAEVQAFVEDSGDEAYRTLVKRLLASGRYGERMAIYWLDLVRYADTVGYHGDQNVSHSPYRDYVIKAFNSNLPYDRFMREQLAGDLLSQPTLDQLVASGYNRLNQTTEEGGAQPKEYLAIYFSDRVRNVSQVFMGATVGCAQCHDHKYDPYTTKDFYSLGAFFADLREVGKYSAGNRDPMIPVPSMEEQKLLDRVAAEIAAAEQTLQEIEAQRLAEQQQWEQELTASNRNTESPETAWIGDNTAAGGVRKGAWKFVGTQDAPARDDHRSRLQQGDRTVQHALCDTTTKILVNADTSIFAWVYLDPADPPKSVMLQWHDGKDWNHRAVWGSDDISPGRRSESWVGYQRQGELPEPGGWVRLMVKAADVGFKPGETVSGMAFTQFGGKAYWNEAGWVDRDLQALEGILAIVAVPAESRTDEQIEKVQKYFLSTDAAIQKQRDVLSRLRVRQQNLLKTVTTMVVSQAVTPRTVRVLPRGNWMDDSGEIVQPAIPEFLGSLPVEGRATRLDLANWLSESDNVLSSRTMVNRLWYLMFGRGICSSVDDFGGQGTFPSHPELLDYLAVEFVESGWDIKHVMELIATSETYRQSSHPRPELADRDPYNELIARQGRHRIGAEMVRDTVLSLSGLLVEQVGGRSVKPYQPAGYYAQLNFPKRRYVADTDSRQYRRGVYTHWQRTFLHPMLKAFDAPSREECTAQRARSNTPLQALTLLNDPTFVEAARVYAARIMREGGESTDERIAWAYKTAVSRDADDVIAAELRGLFELHHTHFTDHADQAEKLVSAGLAPTGTDLDAPSLAAWTSVARVIFNLHETINRY